jgi:hypothetical protein
MTSVLPVNPRYGVPAISWSDVIAIESNVSAWYKRATGVMGKRESPSLSYGTFVHNQIQRRAKVHPEIKNIPHGHSPEEVIVYNLRYRKGHKKVPHSFLIVGTPDDADDDTIYEYKTGLKLWTRKQAEDHGQLRTYALLRASVNKGKYPKRALLVSLETANDEDAGIYLTGNTRVLEVPITKLEILKIQARFIAAYEKAVEFMHTLEA